MRTIRQRCGIQNSRHAVYLAGGDLKGHDYFFVAIGAVSYLQLLGETQGRTILVDHSNGAQLRSIGEAQGHVADIEVIVVGVGIVFPGGTIGAGPNFQLDLGRAILPVSEISLIHKNRHRGV